MRPRWGANGEIGPFRSLCAPFLAPNAKSFRRSIESAPREALRSLQGPIVNLDPVLLLTGYSVAIVVASLIGVWVQDTVRLTHTRMQAAMSFVAGLVLGVALYHLLPHGLARISSPRAVEIAMWWMVAGMVLMLLLLRVFHFHQHDFGDAEDSRHGSHRQDGSERNSLNWLGITLGMGMHTLTEGVALGATVRSGWHDSAEPGPVSLGIFLAILMHKPLDALSILGSMRIAGIGRRPAVAVTAGIALLCPLSAFLTLWGMGLLGAEGDAIGRALAFAAGALLCISLSDLLPEVHFHSHDRLLLTISFLLGIALAYAIHYLENLPMDRLAG